MQCKVTKSITIVTIVTICKAHVVMCSRSKQSAASAFSHFRLLTVFVFVFVFLLVFVKRSTTLLCAVLTTRVQPQHSPISVFSLEARNIIKASRRLLILALPPFLGYSSPPFLRHGNLHNLQSKENYPLGKFS